MQTVFLLHKLCTTAMRTTNYFIIFYKEMFLFRGFIGLFSRRDSSLPVRVIESLPDQHWELISLFSWLWLGHLFIQAGAVERKKNKLPGEGFFKEIRYLN